MKYRRNTIAEVAERAGVSPTTVSHVLSGNRPVAAATRERVQQAIDELGYRPSGLARSLRLQRSDTIALIVPDIANPFYPVFARGVDEGIEGRYLSLLCNTDASREVELRFVADLRDRHVDGMIVATFGLEQSDLEDVLTSGLPIVSLGDAIRHPRVDIVLTDDEHGGFEATQHLLERGHRRIGMIGATEGAGPLRVAGYERAIAAAGQRPDPRLTVDGGWSRHGGADAMRGLLDLSEPPTAVFAANDLMAIGALDVAVERGLSVPDDIALVGYDDIEAASLVSPALTTVHNPAYEAGVAAGRMLLERMSGAYTGDRREVLLQSRLVVRGSSRSPAGHDGHRSGSVIGGA